MWRQVGIEIVPPSMDSIHDADGQQLEFHQLGLLVYGNSMII